ncbi:MAG TPA: hypothetical protein VKE98_12260 [Gemmataceae bacterium]|nr:hypothetical protein [Gemmataceae bacterium]
MAKRYFVGFMLCFVLAGFATADPADGSSRSFWHCVFWESLCPPTGCCPDDYVIKPFPAIHRVPCCGSEDDYCIKPFPCVPTQHCGGPDDYCPKPFPTLLCPPHSPYLQCGPSPCDACNHR